MTEKIAFAKHIQTSTIHNPMMNNALDTQTLEVRRDPLTGSQSVFNQRLEDKVAMFYGESDAALIQKLARDSELRCFLCGDRWKEMTPTYPEEMIPSGRIQVGQAVLFPNLFPVSQVHAVIRVGDRHYVPLDDFHTPTVQEAFETVRLFAKALSKGKSNVDYLTINGNYLGPAGASIAHPHFQVVGGDMPPTYLERLLSLGRRYFDKNQSCYWSDLVATEMKTAERYIGTTGPVNWLAAFSPEGTNEVLGVMPERTRFTELSESDLSGLSEGLVRVLKGYADMGISTFNFAVYSGPMGESDPSFRCMIRIISRQNVYENYRTDDYFLQKLLRNELILTPPEKLAGILTGHFNN
ncbi:MAG: hypothetical protein JRH15_10760 [Deltaproteobacteria bacterium]|nr:hypothetical protein [Deltaproteobacteria bacterium]